MAPMGVLHKLTVDEAMARRDAILRHLGTSLESLRDRSARYELDAAEEAALAELDDLDFLLGEHVE